eukprot:Phypoly_transcript_21064.p1 GENE.Phypoly_transcript_21064~~Phypoly_transcript_21064.p1  ORF type:complete len:196 (+),score=16.85 Phypoly_transcript_21064:61-648(+)
MGVSYKISSVAYNKLILHAHKYAFSAVCGILVGSASGDNVEILDAIPLFHTPPLAPLFEVAMIQIEEYFHQQGLSIVGSYFANETFDDKQLSTVTKRIADKLVTDFTSACILLIDNTKLGPNPEAVAVQTYTRVSGEWKNASPAQKNGAPGVDFMHQDTLEKLHTYISQQKQNNLVDFDNHFDDPSKDWLNPQFK